MSRIEPDKIGYEEEMATFIRSTVANYPRTAASIKITLATEANRRLTQQFGVEINVIMTKLFGEERDKFGFSQIPDYKHFAIKIYGKVYEFGPYQDKIRKSLFLDWCTNNLAFEFATNETNCDESDDVNGVATNNKRQPIICHTMKFETEMDEWVEEYRQRTEEYHPIRNSCLKFVKAALLFLDPKPTIDSEIQNWLFKYQQSIAPDLQKLALQLQQSGWTNSSTTTTEDEIEQINLCSSDSDHEIEKSKP